MRMLMLSAACMALVGNGQRLTYAQLGDGVAKVARRLFRLGVRQGDKVRIRMIDALKASVLDDGGDGGFLYLLMPVRI